MDATLNRRRRPKSYNFPYLYFIVAGSQLGLVYNWQCVVLKTGPPVNNNLMVDEVVGQFPYCIIPYKMPINEWHLTNSNWTIWPKCCLTSKTFYDPSTATPIKSTVWLIGFDKHTKSTKSRTVCCSRPYSLTSNVKNPKISINAHFNNANVVDRSNPMELCC